MVPTRMVPFFAMVHLLTSLVDVVRTVAGPGHQVPGLDPRGPTRAPTCVRDYTPVASNALGREIGVRDEPRGGVSRAARSRDCGSRPIDGVGFDGPQPLGVSESRHDRPGPLDMSRVTPLTITVGGYQPPASIHNQAALRFGERLAHTLGDRIAFDLIGNVLDRGRPSRDLPMMVERGELSLCYMSTVRFSEWVPELQLLELPFLVRDRATAWTALDGELGALFTDRLNATTPFRVLGLWDNGFRHLSNRVRPIRRPEDCRGLTIRSQVSALHGEVFRAMGFEPIPVDIKHFLAEIGGGRFDAQDNPLTNIYTFGVHRHHPYITLSAHFFGASVLIAGARQFQSWPPEVRAAVEAAAEEATVFQRQLAASEDEGVLEKLDMRENDVIELTPEEHAAFVAAVEPVLTRHRHDFDPKLFAYLGGP